MTEEKANPNEKTEASTEKPTSFLDSKLFRIITLGIYLGGVGGLGFTLAMYYLFIWESKMPTLPIIKKI